MMSVKLPARRVANACAEAANWMMSTGEGAKPELGIPSGNPMIGRIRAMESMSAAAMEHVQDGKRPAVEVEITLEAWEVIGPFYRGD